MLKQQSKLAIFVLAIVSLLLGTLSCEDEGPTNMAKFGGTVSATVGGEFMSTDENSIYVFEGSFNFENRFQPYLNFSFNNGITETTYDIGIGLDCMFSYDNAYGMFGTSKIGEVVITEINEAKKTMSGTFYATLKNFNSSAQITIANGVFTDVPYVVQYERSGSKSVAEVDGVVLKGITSAYGYDNGSSYSTESFSGYKLFQLAFPNGDSPAVYDISTFDGQNDYLYFIDGLRKYKATAGTITVTEHDTVNKKIKGTFSATVESVPVSGITKEVTNGVFSFQY